MSGGHSLVRLSLDRICSRPEPPTAANSPSGKISETVLHAIKSCAEALGDGTKAGKRRTVRRVVLPPGQASPSLAASPGVRLHMVQEASSAEPFSSPIQRRLRHHVDHRWRSLGWAFAELGAFRGCGLYVRLGGALLQSGRGSTYTPAAHISLAPVVVLWWPRDRPLPPLDLPTLRALISACPDTPKALRLHRELESRGAQDPTLREQIHALCVEGVVLQGLLMRQGATTTEVPKSANDVDSDLERCERAVIEEAMNAVVHRGEGWRESYQNLTLTLAQRLESLLQTERGYLDTLTGLQEALDQSRVEGLQAQIEQLLKGPQPTSRWSRLIPLLRRFNQQGGAASDSSPVVEPALLQELQRLMASHHHKCEALSHYILTFGSPEKAGRLLQQQSTPSPATVAGSSAQTREWVARRRLRLCDKENCEEIKTERASDSQEVGKNAVQEPSCPKAAALGKRALPSVYRDSQPIFSLDGQELTRQQDPVEQPPFKRACR